MKKKKNRTNQPEKKRKKILVALILTVSGPVLTQCRLVGTKPNISLHMLATKNLESMLTKIPLQRKSTHCQGLFLPIIPVGNKTKHNSPHTKSLQLTDTRHGTIFLKPPHCGNQNHSRLPT